MQIVPGMVDMARTPAEKEESAQSCIPSAKDQPNYPWGLSISLCDQELEKLGIDYDEINVDDIVHMHCLAVVTSKSSNAVQGTEPTCRIELQITNIAAEDEGEENDEAETKMTSSKKMSKLYNS